MPLIPEDLIDEVRDFHPGFTRKVLPDPMLMRALARAESRIFQRVTDLNEDAFMVTYTLEREELEEAATRGVKLPPNLMVLDCFYEREGGGILPVPLVQRPESREGRWRGRDHAHISGGVLHLRTDRHLPNWPYHGWEGLSRLVVRLVAMPKRVIDDPCEPLSLPDVAHEALVWMVARWAAMRLGVLGDLPSLPEQAQAAEDALVDTLADQDSTSTWLVQVVHPV